jgi:hypothetical protein
MKEQYKRLMWEMARSLEMAILEMRLREIDTTPDGNYQRAHRYNTRLNQLVNNGWHVWYAWPTWEKGGTVYKYVTVRRDV